jgi:hypothetical protein
MISVIHTLFGRRRMCGSFHWVIRLPALFTFGFFLSTAASSADLMKVDQKVFKSNLAVQAECKGQVKPEWNTYVYVAGDCDGFGRPTGYAEAIATRGILALYIEGPFKNGLPAPKSRYTVRMNKAYANNMTFRFECNDVELETSEASNKLWHSTRDTKCFVNASRGDGSRYSVNLAGNMTETYDGIEVTNGQISDLVVESGRFNFGTLGPFEKQWALSPFARATIPKSKYVYVKNAVVKASLWAPALLRVEGFSGVVSAILNPSSELLEFEENTEKIDRTKRITDGQGRTMELMLAGSSTAIVTGFQLPDGTKLDAASGYSKSVDGIPVSSLAEINGANKRATSFRTKFEFGGLSIVPKFGRLTLPSGEVKEGVFND